MQMPLHRCQYFSVLNNSSIYETISGSGSNNNGIAAGVLFVYVVSSALLLAIQIETVD